MFAFFMFIAVALQSLLQKPGLFLKRNIIAYSLITIKQVKKNQFTDTFITVTILFNV